MGACSCPLSTPQCAEGELCFSTSRAGRRAPRVSTAVSWHPDAQLPAQTLVEPVLQGALWPGHAHAHSRDGEGVVVFCILKTTSQKETGGGRRAGCSHCRTRQEAGKGRKDRPWAPLDAVPSCWARHGGFRGRLHRGRKAGGVVPRPRMRKQRLWLKPTPLRNPRLLASSSSSPLPKVS